MIPDDVVDRVREEADIISIIGEFVKLKRVGNSFRGPCPFHHGKHDNFSVTTKGGYKCFKCGESGDVFTFVQKHLGLDFIESVKWVGGRSGVEVREVTRRTEERDSREPLWEVNASAADFFRTQLWESDAGRDARAYLASRAIGREEADRFGLGYAPRGTAMQDALRSLGFDDARQVAAGVLITNEERPEPRARFRDRVIFPIYDASSHVVGFGGRTMGDGTPKYLNSAESEIFAKRSLLYGLNWAKQAIRKADRLIIVEGYFDAIRLMLAGINEVVAPLGTALTEQQAVLIRKYTKNVFLLYDSDKAGLKATFRSGDVLLAHDIAVRVISLPDGDDPDTFVAKHGAEGFERAAAASVDVFDRKIQILERTGWFADLGRKRKAIDMLLLTIRVVSDRLTRDLYVSRVSEVGSVSREMIMRELAAAPRERRAPAETGGPPSDVPAQSVDQQARVRRQDRRADHRARGVRAEREVARVLLHQRRYVETAAERVGADSFVDGAYRAIFHVLTTHDPDAPLDELAASLDDETTQVMQELLDEHGGLDRAEEVLDASINALSSRGIATRMAEIDRELPLASSEQQDQLIQEKRRLQAELQALGRQRWKAFNPS